MGYPPQGFGSNTDQIWAYPSRIITNLSNSRAKGGEVEVGWPVDPDTQTLAAGIGDMDTLTVTPTMPIEATLLSAKLISMITAVNYAGAAPGVVNNIDLTIEARKGTEAWSTQFAETAVIGLPDVDGTTVAWAGAIEISDVVDETGVQYSFRFSIAGATTQIRYTQGFVLVLKYRMD